MIKRFLDAGGGVNLDALARYLGGTVTSGTTITFPGPGHSSRDRSASVTFTQEAWNGVFKSHSYSSWQDVPEIERLVFEALDSLGWKGEEFGEGEALVGTIPDSRGRAKRIWQGRWDPRGTVVEKYLSSREVGIPQGSEEIAFLPSARFGKDTGVPVMVCRVLGIKTGEFLAIHRTALSAEGRKSFHDFSGVLDCRAFLGSPRGGAIKLLPAGKRLGVAEGLETALSLREFGGEGDLPVWSLMTASSLASFPLIDGVEELVVAEDNDEAGILASWSVASRWRKAGRKVRVVGTRGLEGMGDLNDVNDYLGRLRHGKEDQGQRARGL